MNTSSDYRAKISFRGALTLWALIVLGYLILLILFRKDDAFRATLNDFLFPVFNGLTVLSLFYAAKLSKPHGRRLCIAWTFMALGQLSFMLGDIVWAFLNYGSHQNPFPSAADGLYLMYYPLFAAGIFLLPAAPLTRGDRLKLSLDAGIVMLFAILFFWIFLIEPIIAANIGDTLALAISLAYPVLDLALLFALLAFLFRPLQLVRQGPLLLLSGGVAIEIITDTIYGLQSLLGTFASGELLSLGWLASYALVGLAAILQADFRKFDPSRPFYEFELQSEKLAWLSYLPHICVFAAYLMFMWNHYRLAEPSSSSILWGVGGGVIGLAIIRQITATNENTRLLANTQTQIKEHMQTEEMLRESEELFRTVFEVAPEVIFTISAKDGSLTSLNPAFERITGWSAAECLGKPFMEIIHPDDRSQAVSLFTETLSGQNTEMHELRCLSKSGEYIIAEIMGVPQTRGGKIVGKLGFARDITERKRSEEALKKSEQSYRLLAETVTDIIWKMDMNLKYSYLSPSFERISGYSTEEGRGMSLEKIMTPESIKVIKQAFAEEMENEKDPKKDLFRSRKIEVEEICKDGKTVWIEVNTTFIRDQEGRPIGIQGSSREITERKRTEKALLESEAKYRTIFENTGNATLILDEDTTISLANTKSAEFFGYSSAEVTGKKSWTEFIYKDDLDMMKKYHSLRRLDPEAAPRNYEFRLLDNAGKIRYVFMTIAMIPGTKQSVASLMGITRIKLSEKKLRASLEEKDLLLKEVHHRVKNNMQVIYSLLNLQSEQIEDPQALRMFKDSQNRVKSMAMVHEKLYRSEDLARINFAEYLRSLTIDLLRSYRAGSDRIQLKIDVQDVFLGIDTAIPCGLITNELVSNSLKHAFPADTKGEIHIELFKGDNGELTLTISDNGIGFPEGVDFRNTESLGLQLVNTLTEQLGGTIELDRSCGTAFKIIFSEIN